MWFAAGAQWFAAGEKCFSPASRRINAGLLSKTADFLWPTPVANAQNASIVRLAPAAPEERMKVASGKSRRAGHTHRFTRSNPARPGGAHDTRLRPGHSCAPPGCGLHGDAVRWVRLRGRLPTGYLHARRWRAGTGKARVIWLRAWRRRVSSRRQQRGRPKERCLEIARGWACAVLFVFLLAP